MKLNYAPQAGLRRRPPDLDGDEMALEHPEALVGGGDHWAA